MIIKAIGEAYAREACGRALVEQVFGGGAQVELEAARRAPREAADGELE